MKLQLIKTDWVTEDFVIKKKIFNQILLGINDWGRCCFASDIKFIAPFSDVSDWLDVYQEIYEHSRDRIIRPPSFDSIGTRELDELMTGLDMFIEYLL